MPNAASSLLLLGCSRAAPVAAFYLLDGLAQRDELLFGLPPADAIGARRNAAIHPLATATNLDEAKAIAAAAGIDAIIARGWEALGTSRHVRSRCA